MNRLLARIGHGAMCKRSQGLGRFGVIAFATIYAVGVFPPLDAVKAQHVHAEQQAQADPSQSVKRLLVDVAIPAVTLVREDGTKVDFVQELNDPSPIFLNFIFTSCTSVCPVMSQIFSMLQDRLGDDRDGIKLISISVDPEYDTPSRLRAYALQFGADAHWRFYGGSREASSAVQKAFGVLTRDKMNHAVASFYRAAPGLHWVRIEGFASPEQLEAEYRATAPMCTQR